MYTILSIFQNGFYIVSSIVFLTGFISLILLNINTLFVNRYNLFSSFYFSLIFPILNGLLILLWGNMSFKDWHLLHNDAGSIINFYFMMVYPVLIILYFIGNFLRYRKFKYAYYKYTVIFLGVSGLVLLSTFTYFLWTIPWID